MPAGDLEMVEPDVFCFTDTCNVYVLRSGRRAVLIDFGRGQVLDRLAELGIDKVTDVLVTHHHRDQIQGIGRAAAAGIRLFAPPQERDLISGVDQHWQARQIRNYYDLRQDRFSLLNGVPVTGWVREYTWVQHGDFQVLSLPTPGHTVGSETYLVRTGGKLLAFSGDLVYGPGQVWSLAATQWTYSGAEGLVATMASCHELGRYEPDVLLPSHGKPVREPAPALALVQRRLQELVDNGRPQRWEVASWYREPWQEITPHLLRNRTSVAISYALLSSAGQALFIDYGYDICGGLMMGVTDRAARRPLLTSLRQLSESFGIDRVEVAIPTHYHDDHVAGFNLLRETQGCEVWAQDEVANVLETPARYDLPCLWHDPVPVQRRIPAGETVRWREYELTLYPLPGHTLYASAICFEVDGHRVIASGDQQNGCWDEGEPASELLNYQYRNRFRIDDFARSAELYQRLRPDLLISGHWAPRQVNQPYLDMLARRGQRLADLHHELLPLSDIDFGAEGFGARIEPYTSALDPGQGQELAVTVKNPFTRPETATVDLVTPPGWTADPPRHELTLESLAEATVTFTVSTDGVPVRRARVAAELDVGGYAFGQQAEALVTVR
jgi:glyoxylase-like metal-dependent hydrolase (beta-lactamase superfamily II)